MPDVDDDEMTDAIESSVTSGIKRAQGDSGSMEEHSIPDRIAGDRYVRSKTATGSGVPFRMVQIIPGGMD